MNGSAPSRNCCLPVVQEGVVPEGAAAAWPVKRTPRLVAPRSLTKDAPVPVAPQAGSALARVGLRLPHLGIHAFRPRHLSTAEGARQASKGGASVSWSDGRPSQVEGLVRNFPAEADQVPVARQAVAEYCERVRGARVRSSTT